MVCIVGSLSEYRTTLIPLFGSPAPPAPEVTAVTATVADGATVSWQNIGDNENFTCIDKYTMTVTYEDASGNLQTYYEDDNIDYSTDGSFFGRGMKGIVQNWQLEYQILLVIGKMPHSVPKCVQ